MIAVRTLVYFILTSLLNAIIGVILVILIHPGDPGLKESIAPSTQARAVNILDSLLDLGRYEYRFLSAKLAPFQETKKNIFSLQNNFFFPPIIQIVNIRH